MDIHKSQVVSIHDEIAGLANAIHDSRLHEADLFYEIPKKVTQLQHGTQIM